MKTFLMHPDRDFDAEPPSPERPISFAQDLELDVLLNAAAAGDKYLYDVMAAACAGAWTNDFDTIQYRQAVLKDCLANPSVIRQFYAIAMEPFGRERSWYFALYGRNPSSMVSSSVRAIQSCLEVLRRLRDACTRHADGFTSQGFQRFFGTLEHNLDDLYLDAAGVDLDNLTFRKGVLLSARLGDGGKGVNTMLREPQPRDLSWIRRLLTPGPSRFTLQLHPRDEAGARALSELQDRGFSLISDALGQSAQHVLSFFKVLRAELAFYVGCLNLQGHLTRIGASVAFPTAVERLDRFTCRGLRDVCLALTMSSDVIGNDVDANGKTLIVVTGANRGGKSTFLRSVGLAQMMLQCGMFVTAESFSSSLHTGLFTHYKRQEDRTMRSGKFDEELVRMSTIADNVRRRGMVLFNESFAATNEREGSEIARQIISALRENGVTVVYVSHMYELARCYLNDDRTLFLRADRSDGGTRDFRLREAKPLPTSFGADLYQRVFADYV